jgi:acyl carrier protein
MIEIAFAVEDAFGITIGAAPVDLMARVKTLADFAAYIDELAPQAVREAAP